MKVVLVVRRLPWSWIGLAAPYRTFVKPGRLRMSLDRVGAVNTMNAPAAPRAGAEVNAGCQARGRLPFRLSGARSRLTEARLEPFCEITGAGFSTP
jgi:hypothetical protein